MLWQIPTHELPAQATQLEDNTVGTISEIEAAQLYRLCRLFTQVVEQIVEAKAREAARRNGKVTAVQYRALEFIHIHSGCCINDLADGLATSHPAALTLVERLAKHRLVRRLRSHHDRRMLELYTTPEGRAFVQNTQRSAIEIINRVFRAMSPNNGFSIDEALHEFIEAVANSTNELPPICLHCGAQHTETCPLANTSASQP